MITTTGLARIGRDAELRYTQGGDAVANLSLAFSYGKRGEDGNRATTWVDATLWGKRAEGLAPYLKKGQAVVVILEDLHQETFTNREGRELTKLAARVSDLELVGGQHQDDGHQGSGQGGQAPRQGGSGGQARPSPQNPPPARQAPRQGYPTSPSGFDDMDSDVPF